MSLLEVKNLRVSFPETRGRSVNAVDNVSLHVDRGESVGLVGESGCGKTTLGNTAIGLERPVSGSVGFEGVDVASLRGRDLKAFRRKAQIVFQDPFGSLNARMSIGSALNEVLKIHGRGNRSERRARVAEMLEIVGLDANYASRYPHEFSGGQRQRVGIARALMLNPMFVVADEPVSALDVSVQAQILNLMKNLQEKMGLSYLFIAHDLAVVRYMCSRVYVMYMGVIVEFCDSARMFERPAHPYTEALLSAIPDVQKGIARRKGDASQKRIVLKGEIPSAITRSKGCRFRSRCLYARNICGESEPVLREVGPGHFSACHFAGDF